MALPSLSRRSIPASTSIEVGAGPLTVTVRVNANARSYRLSLSPRGEALLTVPRGGRWPEAEAFLLRNRGWLEARLARFDSPYSLAPGGIIPLRGEPHRLVSIERIRGVVTRVEAEDGPHLHVPGGADHMRRRLVDWLKSEARADLDRACARHAQTLGVQVAGISIRDQSTRWGSCSSARTLNFNWRLILAPPHVLDYVAAHEVAHILEMNHRPVFWRTVARALPDYEKGQGWLKTHGAALMAL
ncbi:MAG TPA: SprT family zinc-dependent metalloprotease [Pelagibacterium sp.]|uniref:M48 family metallopeptidase n=1 Tax=Pelagibacterium sp. TaxID=1967288 RepID=UPI002D17512A|nr:SprT family zinc-dependent metalloprotease [Pelagibacterium sp.]HWJ86480.1 SprT family zinc-dependent metalloprotease [Pelagibacterium sp.]